MESRETQVENPIQTGENEENSDAIIQHGRVDSKIGTVAFRCDWNLANPLPKRKTQSATDANVPGPRSRPLRSYSPTGSSICSSFAVPPLSARGAWGERNNSTCVVSWRWATLLLTSTIAALRCTESRRRRRGRLSVGAAVRLILTGDCRPLPRRRYFFPNARGQAIPVISMQY